MSLFMALFGHGAISVLSALSGYNGSRTSGPSDQLLTDFVAKVENRTTPEISRKLLFGLLYRYLALQRDYGGP
jgi:hypothetical protein